MSETARWLKTIDDSKLVIAFKHFGDMVNVWLRPNGSWCYGIVNSDTTTVNVYPLLLQRVSYKGRAKGILLASRHGIGWSSCRLQLPDSYKEYDEYSFKRGLRIAMGRLLTGSNVTVPIYLQQAITELEDRRNRYFQLNNSVVSH